MPAGCVQELVESEVLESYLGNYFWLSRQLVVFGQPNLEAQLIFVACSKRFDLGRNCMAVDSCWCNQNVVLFRFFCCFFFQNSKKYWNKIVYIRYKTNYSLLKSFPKILPHYPSQQKPSSSTTSEIHPKKKRRKEWFLGFSRILQRRPHRFTRLNVQCMIFVIPTTTTTHTNTHYISPTQHNSSQHAMALTGGLTFPLRYYLPFSSKNVACHGMIQFRALRSCVL